MEENKKQFNWKNGIIIVMAGLLLFCLAKINQLSEYNKKLENKIARNTNDLSLLQDEINSIYHNVDEQLKQQASLLSGVDFSIGELSEDMKSVELILTVVPKTISDDMQLSVTVDGKTASLSKNSSGFTGVIDVGLFVDYNQWPLLTIQSADGMKTEYLEDIDISYLFSRYLPTLYADMSEGGAAFTKGKLNIDLGFTIESKPAYGNAPITFTSFTLIEEVNGREIARKDITSDVRKSGESYNTRYIETFEVSQGDQLKVYVVAEDALGYIHKTLAHYWYESEDGGQAEAVFGGESIYDSEGNLLYGEKY